jgi:hypothetical protein
MLPLFLVLLAKATIILLAALGITFAMQRASAGARHLVWLVTLGTLLLVPALTAWSPLRMEILPATHAIASVTQPFPLQHSSRRAPHRCRALWKRARSRPHSRG